MISFSCFEACFISTWLTNIILTADCLKDTRSKTTDADAASKSVSAYFSPPYDATKRLSKIILMIKLACFVGYSSLWLDSHSIFLMTKLLYWPFALKSLTIGRAQSPKCYISWSCCVNCVKVLKDITFHKRYEWRFLKLFHPSEAKHLPFS